MNSNDGEVAKLAEVAEIANALVLSIAQYRSVVVAFSGGVDSALVAAAALKAIQGNAIAITGIGSAVASSELDSARSVAASIGIRHIELLTGEIDDANYVRNDAIFASRIYTKPCKLGQTRMALSECSPGQILTIWATIGQAFRLRRNTPWSHRSPN